MHIEISNENLAPEVLRCDFEYKNLSSKFKPPENFSNQYFHIYTKRLSLMRSLLESRIHQKWGNQYPVCKLGEILDQGESSCIITGTIFKDQILKPSVLKEISEENQLIPQPLRTHFTADDDKLILEDEYQRIHLFGELNVHNIVTGVVCAVLGHDIGIGKFQVEDYVFIDCCSQVPRPILEDDKFVVFMSGLDIANPELPLFSFQLFIDWISGYCGDNAYQKDMSKYIKLIIAGNSIRSSQDTKNKKSFISQNIETEETFQAVQVLDDYLEQLTQSINLDIMPGEFDPSHYMMPQQPLHSCMFPHAKKYQSFHRVTNPYEFDIEGTRILGSSGQPLHEILRYSRIESSIEALELCVKWGHLCPTAPDTLASYPFYNTDPYIISECPHVIFAGNQKEFKTTKYKGPENQSVRLICIPDFCESQTVVVLNLKTLDCYPISFKVS